MHFSNTSIAQLLLLLILHSGPVYAQDDTTVADNKEKQQQETKKNAVNKSSPEVETPDTFKATEQLSEDIAADFPVDI